MNRFKRNIVMMGGSYHVECRMPNSKEAMQCDSIFRKYTKGKVNVNAEEQISYLEDRIMEIIQSCQQTENKLKKHESNIRSME